MNVKERKAWISFILVVKNFLGNKKAENYNKLVETKLNNFKDSLVIQLV